MAGITQGLLGRLFTSATVTDAGWATPRIRSITLTSETDLTWTPGQQLRVAVQEPFSRGALRSAMRDVLRTYSVWSLSGRTVELRVLVHGDTPGARWATAVQAGDPVLFRGPEGDFGLAEHAGLHLFVGDETACGAFGPMTAAAFGCTVAAIETESADEQLALTGDTSWVYRHGGSGASSQRLVDAVRSLDVQAPEGPHTAYLAGEARTIQLVRSHLVDERGWDRKAVRTKPFWTPGKRGME
jgi:NADPH-dependent ferric siderophore reductase